jgi:predicted CXXCH cytochrome family protein
MTRMDRGKGREVACRADKTPAGRASIVGTRTHKEVRTVRRFALLLAGGALWLILAASAAYADGGPHQLAVNNGTSGLSGDCAACHRAHTAQAADLLKASMPGLCLTCHNGTGATTDVTNGVQYTPTGNTTFQQSAVLGALRGGGFSYALLDTSHASRLTYASRGAIILTFGAAPNAGNVTLAWPAFGSFAGGDLTFLGSANAATIQTAANLLFGTSNTYINSTAASSMTGTTSNLMSVAVSTTAHTVSFTPKNEFALVPAILLPTVTVNGSGTTATMSSTIQANVGEAGHVGVLAVKAATTSSHEGAGTVWGNGPQGQGNVGATGVALECTNCHNPHGNGQYRILDTTPGEDWSTATGVANWTAPTNAVEVVDVGSTATTKNYTVLPAYTGSAPNFVVSYQASDVHGTAAQGDYFRYKFDPTGQANFTNFYLKADEMNTGWNGTSATNKLANAGVSPANSTGLMTAWCITCHTRYNGYNAAGTTSLVQPLPMDAIFNYKHGTTRVGCEQCHVSHGTDALMTAEFSSTYKLPDGTAEDSALLKVDNRGTCNLCHDPTHTVTPSTTVGVVPVALTPGP